MDACRHRLESAAGVPYPGHPAMLARALTIPLVLLATGCVAGSDEPDDPGPTRDELFAICEDTAACIPASCLAETEARDEHNALEPDLDDPAWEDWLDELKVLSDARWACLGAACFGAESFEDILEATEEVACINNGERLDETCAVALGVKGQGWCDNIYFVSEDGS